MYVVALIELMMLDKGPKIELEGCRINKDETVDLLWANLDSGEFKVSIKVLFLMY